MNWTENETIAVIGLYQRMLDLHRQGLLGPARSKGQTSKREMMRTFVNEYATGRSVSSVEKKLQNIAHIQFEKGLPVIPRLAPLSNVTIDLGR